MPCTVTSTLVPPSTEITRRTITFPVSSPICSPSMALSFRFSIRPRQTDSPVQERSEPPFVAACASLTVGPGRKPPAPTSHAVMRPSELSWTTRH